MKLSTITVSYKGSLKIQRHLLTQIYRSRKNYKNKRNRQEKNKNEN